MAEPGVERPNRSLTRPGATSAFSRLARTHAAGAAGDAAVAIALAGSLFFDVSAGESRGKVALYLLFTMAPFAVIAPLVGPMLDRVQGGRRILIAGFLFLRALVCLLMAKHLKSAWLFPEAFTLLVLAKAYAISKNAVVPSVVRNEAELVEANSKLGLLSGIAGFAVSPIALLIRLVGGGSGVVILAAMLFGVGGVLALALPRERAGTGRTTERDREALRSGGITLAGSAMGLLRACVGFLSFHLAFWLRSSGSGTVRFAMVLAATGVGTLVGNALAPRVRRRVVEENMLLGSLTTVAVVGVIAAALGGVLGAALLSSAVGLGASVGRLAFDSIVQRDGQDANRARAFARFETRFQMAWVLAGFLPVLVAVPGSLGLFIVAVLAAVGAVSYFAGARYLRRRGEVPRSLAGKVGDAVRRRRALEMGRQAKPRRPDHH